MVTAGEPVLIEQARYILGLFLVPRCFSFSLQATNIARAMVTQCGMSEKVGMVFVKDQREEGDQVRAAIDTEVSKNHNKSLRLL